MFRVRIKVGFNFYLGKDKDGDPDIVNVKHAAEFATREEAQAFRQQYIDQCPEYSDYRALKTEVI